VIVGLEGDFRFAVCHESISGIKLDSQADINFIFFNIDRSLATQRHGYVLLELHRELSRLREEGKVEGGGSREDRQGSRTALGRL